MKSVMRSVLLHVSLLLATTAGNRPPAEEGEKGVPWGQPPALAAEGRDIDAEIDSALSETHNTKMIAEAGGHGAAMHGHGKFFQYQNHDGKDHYENGFRRGNEHHFHERHEKAAPKHGHFTTKVRWGDKHGGYGEHYWDYNHGGHHHGDGDGGGEGSAPIADISPASSLEQQEARSHFKRQSDQAGAESATPDAAPGPGMEAVNNRRYRKKYVRPSAAATKSSAAPPMHLEMRKPTTPRPAPRPVSRPAPSAVPDKLAAANPFLPKTAKSAFLAPDFPGSVFVQGTGLGPRTARETAAGATGPQTIKNTQGSHSSKNSHKSAQGSKGAHTIQSHDTPKIRRLAFDPRTGRVHDEETGQVFELHPVS